MQGSELDRIWQSFMSAPLAFRPAHEAAFLLPLFFFYARVRRVEPIAPAIMQSYFNPRIREGCDEIDVNDLLSEIISIHAPLAGCDQISSTQIIRVNNFNPRTPCGVRQQASIHRPSPLEFQSTHPLRGATPPHHTTHELSLQFNPRTPCGVRRKTSSR